MKKVLCSALLFLTLVSSQVLSHVLFVNDPDSSPSGNTENTYGSKEKISVNNNGDVTSSLTFTGFSNSGNRNADLLQTSSAVPGGYYLGQKAPGPFDPVTNIYFSLPVKQQVRIVILDMLGQTVRVLINDVVNAGTYKLSIDGSGLSSGVYVYWFESENFSDSRKLLLVK